MKEVFSKIKSTAEKVKLKSGRFELAGLLEKPENPRASIILCHGMSVYKDEDGIFKSLSARLVEKGFEVLRFDFRAHGQSTGEFMDFTVDGELQDLDAAHSFVKSLHSKVDDRGRVQQSDWKIGLLGASFGGGIAAMHAAGNVDIQALCLWNPALAYSDYYSGNPRTAKNKARFSKEKLEFLEAHGYLDVNQKKFRVGRQWIASLKAHNPMESLHRITQPTLVVHGEADASVPVQDSIEANKQLAKGTLEILENAEHGFHEPEAERLAVLLTVKFFDEKLKP